MNQPGYVIRSINDERIFFGRNEDQKRHAMRHVQEHGLPEEDVKQAILLDLVGTRVPHQGSFKGTLKMLGHTLRYSAYRLPNGDINVGRIDVKRHREEPGLTAG